MINSLEKLEIVKVQDFGSEFLAKSSPLATAKCVRTILRIAHFKINIKKSQKHAPQFAEGDTSGSDPSRAHMEIKIIYEDKDALVINKPAGIAVHPDNTHKTGTLIQEILKVYPEIKNVGDLSIGSGQVNLRPGIVHRLDKDTSGAMIVAKNQPAFEYLKSQFQEHKIKKTYIALICGKLKEKEGVIDLPIGRSRKSPVLRLASEKARGKLREAITEYKVLEFFSVSSGDNFTLVEVYPKTGRTHQIRVHFKAIGHPVVCDHLYGIKKEVCPAVAGLKRQFLHASSLELTLSDGSRSRFEADLPEDLENVLRQLRENNNYDKNR